MAVKIDDFSKPKNIDYGKVFLVLYFKKITWKADLQKEFGIPSDIINDSIKILKKWDLVVEENFNSLEIKEKENTWELNSSYYTLLKKKPSIYKITSKYKEGQGYFLLTSLKKGIKNNENLKNFVKYLISKTGKKDDEFGFFKEINKEQKNKNSSSKKFETNFEIEVEPEEIEYFKVFLVLYMKGFSWKKELENDFNISKSSVQKSIELLERRGFIIAKDFWSLDLDSQECIRRLNGAYMSLIKTHPQIYTLSIEGRDFGKKTIQRYKEIAENNSSLRATIEFISEKIKAYNILKKKFEELENNNWVRLRVDHESGLIYETDTKKKIEFERKLNINAKIIRKEKLEKKSQEILTSKLKQELAILNEHTPDELAIIEEKRILANKNGFIYNNSYINSIERAEIEKKLIEIEKEDKKLEKVKAKIGIDENEVEKNHLRRFNELKKQLGIISKNKNLKEYKEDKKICDALIKKIKKKKWMDVWIVQKECGNERVYNLFLKLAKENNIEDDGEDFTFSIK